MFRCRLMAAVAVLGLMVGGGVAEARSERSAPPVPRTVSYTGSKIALGSYTAIADADLWRQTPAKTGPWIDGDLVNAQREWREEMQFAQYQADAQAKEAFEACKAGPRPKRCSLKAPKIKVAPEPVDKMPTTGDDRVDAMRKAYIRHLAGPKPEGWAEKVIEIAGEPSLKRKLELADAYIDAAITYVDRGDPWALTPAEALATGGLCRDYAFAKMALLLDAGYDPAALRVITVLPASAGANGDTFHVVLVARTGKKSWVLDMRNPDKAKGGYAIPLAAKDDPITGRGLLWSGNLAGGYERGPGLLDSDRQMVLARQQNTHVAEAEDE